MRPTTRIICLSVAFLISGPGAYQADAQEGVSAAASSVPPASTAITSGAASADAMADWTPVSAETLDETRGGFDMGNGLVASFGIDRAVYVNGNLVTQTSFNVPDIAHMTTAQATAMSTALNSVAVTQVGGSNTFDPTSLGGVSAGTVIQNTLNNQTIKSITTVNATVNSLNAFQQMNLQQSLQQTQLQSLGH